MNTLRQSHPLNPFTHLMIEEMQEGTTAADAQTLDLKRHLPKPLTRCSYKTLHNVFCPSCSTQHRAPKALSISQPGYSVASRNKCSKPRCGEEGGSGWKQCQHMIQGKHSHRTLALHLFNDLTPGHHAGHRAVRHVLSPLGIHIRRGGDSCSSVPVPFPQSPTSGINSWRCFQRRGWAPLQPSFILDLRWAGQAVVTCLCAARPTLAWW